MYMHTYVDTVQQENLEGLSFDNDELVWIYNFEMLATLSNL